MRFGGTGHWFNGPEALMVLRSGEIFSSGITRFQMVEGGWKEAHYAHRAFMRAQGVRTRDDYKPTLHWHALYDAGCPGPGQDQSFFTAGHLLPEIDKAKEIGAETLEIEPGWDTAFCNGIWALDRMGPMDVYVRELREKHGLGIALHTALVAWSEPGGYPDDARRMNEDGTRVNNPAITNNPCNASRQYIDA